MSTFQELQVSSQILKAIGELGFEEATPIQEKAIPIVMGGGDVIGLAQTGTGKTAAFGIPMLQTVEAENGDVQGLILTPTRELAIQVAEELMRLSKFTKVKILPIYGGQDIQRQIRSLKNKPQIIVGTPGRILDHINRKTLKLGNIKQVILDEADEMLDMGFQDELEAILAVLPSKRQTLLFSATMAKQIRSLADKYLNNPEEIKVKTTQLTVPSIEQYYLKVAEDQKFDVLCRVLDLEAPGLAIIFGRTKRRVDELSEGLVKRGYFADGIHGDLSQNQRNLVMKKFKGGQLDILVATDVAARGIDVTGVTHVFNFDMPQTPDSYVHRIGRTGRAGKEGISYTFVIPREMSHLEHISRTTNANIVAKKIPSATDALEGKQRLAAEKLIQTVQENNLIGYEALAKNITEEHSAVSIVAAALKLLSRESSDVEVRLTPERPLRVKQEKGNRSNRNRRYSDDRRERGNKERGNRDRSGNRSNKDRDGRGNRERSNQDRDRGGQKGNQKTIKMVRSGKRKVN